MAMVTNILPNYNRASRSDVRSVEISFTKWPRGAKTGEL